ncbi:MAG: hypothetical protein L0170_00250, partial [Acidobacteria bacterium]|nr:hypothetical protein [Acidobacteriota bacterium]
YSIAHDTPVPLTRHLQNCPAGLNSFFDRALSKDPAKRYLDGPAFREAFLKAGKQLPAEALDRTVVDANTVKLAPPAYQTVRADIQGPAETSPVPVRGRRGRLLGLSIAALALLTVGLAAAAYLRLGRPALLRADDRGLHGPQVTASSSATRPAPLAGSSAPREQVPQMERAMPPQAGSVRRQETLNQEKATAPQGSVMRHQEPMLQARTAPQRAIVPTNADSVPDLPPMPRKIQMTLPEGTEMRLNLIEGVGSSSSQAGDTFTARITTPVVSGDRVVIPAGSSVHGFVSEAIPARKGLSDKAGSLSLSFDRVIRPDGSQIPMSAVLTRVGPKSGKKTAGIIGGSAAGGALLGKVLGGNTKDAVVGSVLGGAIGTGVAAGTRGEDVELPAGSPLTINLDQPLAISIKP